MADTDITVLAMELIDAYESMSAARKQFLVACASDSDFPCTFPEQADLEPELARRCAEQSLTRMWIRENIEHPIASGLMCVSAATAQAAADLNDKKDSFQDAVRALRDWGASQQIQRVDLALAQLCGQIPERGQEVAGVLKRANLSALDLVRTYCHIRVIPSDVTVFSVTWARRHSSIESVTREKAIKTAESLPDSILRNRILDKLALIGPDERLASPVRKKPQMRANLVFNDGRRKPITLSGVTLVAGETLPEFIWRERPDPADSPPPRLTRSDSALETEPYIEELGLHRYRPECRV